MFNGRQRRDKNRKHGLCGIMYGKLLFKNMLAIRNGGGGGNVEI